MKITSKILLAAIVAGGLALAFPTTTNLAVAQESKQESKQEGKPHHKDKHEKSEAAAKIGSLAPTFKLTDTEGKTHDLAELTKSGKIVVLEWFNPDCPFVKKHHEANTTFADLYKNYKDKGVVFLAINSGASGEQGAGKERNQKAKTDYKIEYPILLDENSEVGHLYGAKVTPHMFVINKEGILVYAGGIDDDASQSKVGKTNYVAKALDEVIAGKEVSTKESKPYGCGVKYGKNTK